MKYLKEFEERELSEKEDLAAYLDSLEDDKWHEPVIADCAAIAIDPETPIIWEVLNEELGFKKGGIPYKVKPVDLEDEAVLECLEKGNGIFLVIPGETSMRTIPTSPLAYPGMCQRAGDDCATMTRFEKKPQKGVLPLYEKVERLTRDFTLNGERCKVLERWGKVMAMHSQAYVPLPMRGLIECLEEELAKDHPDYTYAGGQVSNEYLTARYLINDEMMEESLRLSLNDAGKSVEELKAGVRLISSDVGNSSVRVSCFFNADGVEFTAGKSVNIAHKGDACMEKIREEFGNIGSLFKETEELIEQLGNIDISDVGNVLLEIRSQYTFLPKDLTEKIAAAHAGEGTAIDVYLALNEIVSKMESSLSAYLNNRETVERMMRLPFKAIDEGSAWNKV